MFLNRIKEIEDVDFIVELAILLVVNYKNSNIQVNHHPDSDYVLLLDTKVLRTESETVLKWSDNFGKKNTYLSNVKETKNDNTSNLFSFSSATFNYNSLEGHLNEASSKVIREYSENKEIKNKVIQLLLDEDIDIMKLTPEIIQDKLLSLPEIQCTITLEAMKYIANENNELIRKLPSKERKYIIFEFIALAIKLNILNLSDSPSISYLFSIFNVGSDYLSEFEDIAHRYNKLDSELLEIINE